MAEGVEERRSKRRPPCNGADRASATRGYPARKGADFRHGLTGWEALDRLGLLEALDGANRTDQRATAVAWSEIDWAAAGAVVKRLQGRIYRAAGGCQAAEA